MSEHAVSTPPSLGVMYLKSLMAFGKPGLSKGKQLPQLSARWVSARVNRVALDGYCRLCGFEDDGHLPLLYPYVLTAPLQFSLMCSRAFPLRAMGMVHVRNNVLQHRCIRSDEAMDVECRIGASRVANKGLEFDLSTSVMVASECVWECISTYLCRGKFGEVEEAAPSSKLPELETVTREASWWVPKDMGRRYARVTGDYNFIHISNLLAKAFGFPRAVVHGMWSAARSISQISCSSFSHPIQYVTLFKGPVFLGSNCSMKLHSDGASHRFDVYCGDNPRPCVSGCLKQVEAGSALLG